MKDVADRAGVSRQLVSLVLRGVAGPSQTSRERVLQAAADLGYQANTSARLLRQNRSGLIGLMFTPSNAFQSAYVERLVELAAEAGFGVVLSPVTSVRTTDVVVPELLGHRVEAMACFNPDPESSELLRALDRIPVVWLGERRGDPRADAVHADDDGGLGLAVEHLVSLGHRSITYVGGTGVKAGPDRARAYRAAMERAGLGEFVDVEDASFEEESAAAAATRLVARGDLPTAVIACSDQCALAVRAVLTAAGVSVPGDVSLVGFDDSALARLSFNDLTSVRQDVDATVVATLSAVRDRLTDPERTPCDVTTPATLSVRSSTGAVREPRVADPRNAGPRTARTRATANPRKRNHG